MVLSEAVSYSAVELSCFILEDLYTTRNTFNINKSKKKRKKKCWPSLASQTCHLDPDRPTQSTINVSKLQKHVHIYKVTWHENTISTRVRGQKSDLWCKVVYGNLENRHILKRLCVEDVKKRVKRVNIIQTSGFPSLLNWKIKEILRESLNTQVSYWTKHIEQARWTSINQNVAWQMKINNLFSFLNYLFSAVYVIYFLWGQMFINYTGSLIIKQCIILMTLHKEPKSKEPRDPISEKFCMVVKRRKTNNFMIPLELSYGLRIWRLSV